MANDTDEDTDATVATTEAPRALADGDTVDVDADLGLAALEPESHPKVEPAEPDRQARPTSRETKGRQGNLGKALREEREEKRAIRAEADQWKRVAEQALRGAGRPADRAVNITWPQTGISADERRRLVDEAKNATDFGQPVERLLDAIERSAAEREKRIQEHLSRQLEHELRVREIRRQEREFVKAGHTDYRDVTQRSGVFELTQFDPVSGKPGPRFDRNVAEAIARADDPIEATYWIAKNLLGEADDESASHPEAADPRRAADPAPASTPSRDRPRLQSTSTEDLVEAERRGAREVAARVADNGAKPRGVRALTPAGTPARVQLNDEFAKHLDGLWDTRPFVVQKYLDEHPDIRDWYEGKRR